MTCIILLCMTARCCPVVYNSTLSCGVQVWDLFFQRDKVRDLITSKIQEESLRTYLFCYSSVYDYLSLPVLAEMFELEKPVVHSIISKMIINEELMVSLVMGFAVAAFGFPW